MNQHLPNDVPGSASGMGTFFSRTNLRRYRSLMDDQINADDRARVLGALAEQWDAFTRECRMGWGSSRWFNDFVCRKRDSK